jgi:hypothetical protein
MHSILFLASVLSFILGVISLRSSEEYTFDAYIDSSFTEPNALKTSRSLQQTEINPPNHEGKVTKGRGPYSRLNPDEFDFISPSNGTDILTRPVPLIRCENQTKCIRPELQLERKFKVYYCKSVTCSSYPPLSFL